MIESPEIILQTPAGQLVENVVTASNFMAFHTILKSSKDYYEALRWARLLTDRLQETINKNLTEDQVHYTRSTARGVR